MRFNKLASGAIVLGGVAIFSILFAWGVEYIASDKLSEPRATSEPHTPSEVQEPSTAPDPLAEMHAKERKNYIQMLNKSLGDGGFARESDEELVIKSPDFDSRAARDQVVSQGFNPNQREVLCSLGFKGIKLYASTFGDSTEYSVCKESKKDRGERLNAEFSKRQEFARNLATLNSNPDIQNIEAIGSELVYTGKGLDPSFFQSNLPLMMDQKEKSAFCGLGFTGMRVRPSPKARGTLISYGCPK